MGNKKLLQQTFGLILIALLLAGCGGAPAEPTATPVPPTATPTSVPPTPTPTPTTGTITGTVLQDDGTPLKNIYDQETLIVALFCLNGESDIECLHEDFWDMDMEVLFDSICEADDTADDCILHLGQGAASVEADGSYTITDIPPGQYGLVFLFKGPGMTQASSNRDVEPVQAGEIIEYDIATTLHRN